MELRCQQSAITELQKLADAGRQSVLIEGPKGCGKSTLSLRYAQMLQIDDYIVLTPKVGEIKDAIDQVPQLQNSVVLSIENLETGVAGAAYTLLKILEEPLPNVFIVITCRNINAVPDTIISRSAVVSIDPPIKSDVVTYAETTNFASYNIVKSKSVWNSVRTFADADNVMSMTENEFSYYDNMKEFCKFKGSISDIVWNMTHYANNQECNVELTIQSIMDTLKTQFVINCCVDALNDLSKGRIAQHAILSKLAFNLKYCE